MFGKIAPVLPPLAKGGKSFSSLSYSGSAFWGCSPTMDPSVVSYIAGTWRAPAAAGVPAAPLLRRKRARMRPADPSGTLTFLNWSLSTVCCATAIAIDPSCPVAR